MPPQLVLEDSLCREKSAQANVHPKSWDEMQARCETGRVSRIKRQPLLAKRTCPAAAALLQSVRSRLRTTAASNPVRQTRHPPPALRALSPTAVPPIPWCP